MIRTLLGKKFRHLFGRIYWLRQDEMSKADKERQRKEQIHNALQKADSNSISNSEVNSKSDGRSNFRDSEGKNKNYIRKEGAVGGVDGRDSAFGKRGTQSDINEENFIKTHEGDKTASEEGNCFNF